MREGLPTPGLMRFATLIGILRAACGALRLSGTTGLVGIVARRLVQAEPRRSATGRPVNLCGTRRFGTVLAREPHRNDRPRGIRVQGRSHKGPGPPRVSLSAAKRTDYPRRSSLCGAATTMLGEPVCFIEGLWRDPPEEGGTRNTTPYLDRCAILRGEPGRETRIESRFRGRAHGTGELRPGRGSIQRRGRTPDPKRTAIICRSNYKRLPWRPGGVGYRVGTAALRLCSVLWLGMFCCLVGLSAAKADEETVFVVAHPDVTVGALGRDTTRALFAMRQRNWPNGDVAHVYVLGDSHPVHVRFAKEGLGVFPHQLRLAWDRAVFSGTGQAPRRVGSQSEMLERVGATPGAIGYLTTEYLDERVQVIEIE